MNQRESIPYAESLRLRASLLSLALVRWRLSSSVAMAVRTRSLSMASAISARVYGASSSRLSSSSKHSSPTLSTRRSSIEPKRRCDGSSHATVRSKTKRASASMRRAPASSSCGSHTLAAMAGVDSQTTSCHQCRGTNNTSPGPSSTVTRCASLLSRSDSFAAHSVDSSNGKREPRTLALVGARKCHRLRPL